MMRELKASRVGMVVDAAWIWFRIHVHTEVAPLVRDADDHRPLFVHIPKTAGTSMARLPVLTTYGHKPWRFYALRLGNDLPTSFAIVRNPVARAYSAYCYLRDERGNALDTLWARRHLSRFGSFGEFARHGLDRPEILRWIHFRPQHAYVTDREGKIAVDHVLRFESLDREWPRAAALLDLPPTLPRLRASRSATYRLTDAEVAAIYRAYEDDFTLFGYRPISTVP